jgi:hypothetical protein
MAELPLAPPARPSDITPEPTAHLAPTPAAMGSITPWVPSLTPPVGAVPSGVGTSPSTSAASFPEIREIEAARDAVSRGDNARALATLDGYDRSHPDGSFKAESAVLRVQALSNGGHASEAKRLAAEFSAKYPAHPLDERLKSLRQ